MSESVARDPSDVTAKDAWRIPPLATRGSVSVSPQCPPGWGCTPLSVTRATGSIAPPGLDPF